MHAALGITVNNIDFAKGRGMKSLRDFGKVCLYYIIIFLVFMKQYPFATLVACISLIIGLILQLTVGSLSKSWFSFPDNIIAGFTFVVITTLVFFIFRKSAFVSRFSSAPFAIVIVAVLGLLTIGLGSINVKPEEMQGVLGKLGLNDLTKTWYFGLIFVLALMNLWFAIPRIFRFCSITLDYGW